jgi:tetratricopeptide (TPR) repeat protein
MRHSSAYEYLFTMGLSASQANDHEGAIGMYAKASEEDPLSGIPHFLMASEYATMGEISKAEAAFANAILLAPDFAIARYQLGLLQFSSGRAALALVTWLPLLNSPSAEPEARALACFVRGYAALAQDDFEQALAHFQTGLTHKTGNQALSDDVGKVIERVQELISNAGAVQMIGHAQGGKLVQNTASALENAEESHVFLNNYQSQGRSH